MSEDVKKILDEHKDYITNRYAVDSFMLFGSYAKNTQTPNSDIDLLVTFSSPIDMFDFIDLQDYLSEIFNKKIDLGTPNSLKNFIKNLVLNEAIKLWAKKIVNFSCKI